jgi:hypothetical protein
MIQSNINHLYFQAQAFYQVSRHLLPKKHIL